VSDVGATVLRSISVTTQRLVEDLGTRVPLLVAALVVLLVAWWVAGVTFVVARRVLARTSTTGHVDLLVARVIRAAVLGVGVVIALGVFGVNPGALIASLGLVGLTLGLALRDVLANYVSGVMLLMQGPFKVGDSIVIDGLEGTVDDITARSTTLRASDGKIIHVPNMTVFGAIVTNVSTNPVRRFEVSLVVPADSDLASARGVVLAALTEVAGVLDDPAADAQISMTGAAWARIVAHGWVDTRETPLGDAQAAGLVTAGRRLREAGLKASHRRQV
jgi:small conductance mechanosensitive channel